MTASLARFEAWWNGTLTGAPLMYVASQDAEAPAYPRPETPAAYYTDIEYLIARFQAEEARRQYHADAFPSFSADLGPGSLALYLGAEPDFQWDTVWYRETIQDLASAPPLAYDPDNRWWRLHQAMMQRAKEALGQACRINIPDLIENLDILAAMHGTENTLFALMDEPELVAQRVKEIDDAYFAYYDAMYDLARGADGSSGYTAFMIQGMGRIAKVQCDISAMLSPAQFREFVLPSLQKQVKRLDKSLYHLDGPDAIRHLPAIMELAELNALQWTCGAGQPDGASERWNTIYDTVVAAGKRLWVQLYDGDVRAWIAGAERLMARYPPHIFYFVFPTMSRADADVLVNHAAKHWTV